jgi:hypothetical protein
MNRAVAAARSAVLLVVLVPLAVGALVAVASQELAFAAWGGTVGVVLALVLGAGLRRGWNGWALLGRLALLGAVATLALGRLLALHGEAVDRGLRGVLGDAYAPSWIAPTTIQNVAIALGIGGALGILISHGAQRLTGWRNGVLKR